MKVQSYGKVKAMVVSFRETTALEDAEKILGEVQSSLGGENTIMSLETGEVITPGELARARAILDFIRTYRMVEINPA